MKKLVFWISYYLACIVYALATLAQHVTASLVTWLTEVIEALDKWDDPTAHETSVPPVKLPANAQVPSIDVTTIKSRRVAARAD